MANCIRCGRQLPGLSFGKKICRWCVQHEAFQRGEVIENTRQPVMDAPWAARGTPAIGLTQVIFGINAFVFLAMVFASGNPVAFANPMQDFSNGEIIRWGANIGAITMSGEWWRLLTCVFLHGSLLHIGFNMWCLWNLGQLAESLYGRWTYAAIYLFCGIGSSLCSAAWGPYRPSVGASGAIFWPRWRAHCRLQAGRIFRTPRRLARHAAQPGRFRLLQSGVRCGYARHRQRRPHRRPHHGTDPRSGHRQDRSFAGALAAPPRNLSSLCPRTRRHLDGPSSPRRLPRCTSAPAHISGHSINRVGREFQLCHPELSPHSHFVILRSARFADRRIYGTLGQSPHSILYFFSTCSFLAPHSMKRNRRPPHYC